jgi:hypothetical protein
LPITIIHGRKEAQTVNHNLTFLSVLHVSAFGKASIRELKICMKKDNLNTTNS